MLTFKLNANDLKYEQSPYLLQHGDNPVNWMAWNDNTFKEALKQNKLIFLSIGYSTCHWCHVMEEESFEDDTVAKVLNENYISIKVDREEMPQIDSHYQYIYQIMNGRGGGWPLTIIMTPDKKVFYSATYIVKENLIGILKDLNVTFKTNNNKILRVTSQIENILKSNTYKPTKNIDLKLNTVIDLFTSNLKENYDKEYGGFSVAPKFPQATTLQSMLELYQINNDKSLLDMSLYTLKAMARGGIYDQIEGGFYRYSVNRKWEIPHFEKMLYTQAELLEVYSKAYLITKDNFFRNIVDEIVQVVNKRFVKENLLFSASDADSLNFEHKKEEGFYFIFNYKSVYEFLKNKKYNKKEIYDILNYFNITSEDDIAYNIGNPYITSEKPPKNIVKIKKDLLELRGYKKYPFMDKKIQTSWNALYIKSLFISSKIDKKYGQLAINFLDTLIDNMYVKNVLYHQKLFDRTLKVKAVFEDYAFLISALIEAYEFNFDTKYIELAAKLTDETIKKFDRNGAWYLSDDEFNSPAKIYDSAYASSLSTMIKNLFKLSLLVDNRKFYDKATVLIKEQSIKIQNNPTFVSTAFSAFVGSKKEYKLLKSTKDNLLANREKIEQLNYPYLVVKAVKEKQYLACTINRCFSIDKDIDKVLKRIVE
ncbi:Thymidylate kinase [hydrothermal vent metagenome]|uniref:Thymidylate kinase n=1 Tax=hydrothermal vent metagenome TaxID=652676 RepID=A0A3B1E4M4_9ZZZZ